MRAAFYACIAIWLLLIWSLIMFVVIYVLTPAPAFGYAAIVCGGGAQCSLFAAIAFGKWSSAS